MAPSKLPTSGSGSLFSLLLRLSASQARKMARLAVAGLCGALLVGGASAFAGSASTFVLSPEFVPGKSASYESLSQDELAAGLLRFSRPGFHTGVIGGAEPWEKNFLQGNGGDVDLIAVVVTRGAADGLPAVRCRLEDAATQPFMHGEACPLHPRKGLY